MSAVKGLWIALATALPPYTQVLKAMLQLARKHEVTVDSGYAALVIGVCVLVGFATSLDPSVNLMDAALPAFLINDLTGRIAGRLYA